MGTFEYSIGDSSSSPLRLILNIFSDRLGIQFLQDLYGLFDYVSRAPLMYGLEKVFKHSLLMWLAIQKHLSTLNKPWLQHVDGICVLWMLSLIHRCFFSVCSPVGVLVYPSLVPSSVRFIWPHFV